MSTKYILNFPPFKRQEMHKISKHFPWKLTCLILIEKKRFIFCEVPLLFKSYWSFNFYLLSLRTFFWETTHHVLVDNVFPNSWRPCFITYSLLFNITLASSLAFYPLPRYFFFSYFAPPQHFASTIIEMWHSTF